MDTGETTYFREQLVVRRQRLETARRGAGEDVQVVRLLAEVDAALQRMDHGTFGLCATCHDPIEPERLVADPLTCFCLDHLSHEQRRALEDDLGLAARIQTSLLPPRSLKAGDWQAHYHYEAAGHVGGDYCDLLTFADAPETLFFAAGDISGKGISASLLMSHLHAIFRSLLPLRLVMAELVGRANRIFCESTISSHYATLVCGLAGPSGEVELCNAGHCPPVLVQGGQTTLLESTGLPLGLFCDGQYSNTRPLQMQTGDSLVLCTDGVTEAHDGSGEEYGVERLCEALRRHSHLPAQQLTEAVLEDLRKFLSGGKKTDDLTLVAIQRG